jgi:predicted SnoaL-like aldol condensation-catalyzing enzyme
MPHSSLKESAVSFLRLAATGRVDEAFEQYISPDFKHHNAYFAGDRESLKHAMADAARQNPKTAIDVKQVTQEGDMVAVFSHVKHRPEDAGFAVVHICRFELDKIVEMWDVGMQIPENSPNGNGVF